MDNCNLLSNKANQTSEENSKNVWIRTKFLEAVLRQDIAWYDTNTTSDFASKMTEDLNKIQDGIGEKMGMLVRFIVTFLGSLIYPYTQNWLVSLVISSVLPLMILFGGMKLCLKINILIASSWWFLDYTKLFYQRNVTGHLKIKCFKILLLIQLVKENIVDPPKLKDNLYVNRPYSKLIRSYHIVSPIFFHEFFSTIFFLSLTVEKEIMKDIG